MASDITSCLNNNNCNEDLLNIARHGLPKTTAKKKIVVVGAGMAGLSAAYVLHRAGHEVTILEASDRVGGRVMTYRDKAGWRVELGAMRIPEEHKIVQHFVTDVFQLQTEEFVEYDPEAYYYVNGVRQKMKDYQKNPESFGFDLLPQEEGMSSFDLLNTAMEPYLQELRSIGYSSFADKYDHLSFKGFLERNTKLSRNAISLIGKLDNVESAMKFSFPVTLMSYYLHNANTKFLCLSGGMDELPNAFQKELNEFLFFNAKVIKISQHTRGVIAEIQSENDSKKSAVKGDYLLMTASAPITAVTEFDPALSIEKQDALRMVFHDTATKIALAFSVRFWEKEGIYGGTTVTDLPTRQFYYFPGNAKFLGGVVLSYTWNHDSYRLTGIGEKECLRLALNNLAEIHGQHIREFYLGGVVKHWLLDPFTLGAWMYPLPCQHSDILSAMNKGEGAEGRVWFAGQCADVPISWMETAVKTGLRAAAAIHNKSMEEMKCKL